MTDLPEQLEEIAKAAIETAWRRFGGVPKLARTPDGRRFLSESAAKEAVALLLSERSTSMERIRELEARLEPFKREADRLDPLPRDPVALINDNVEIWQCGDESFRRSRITYGDLRAARSALQHRDRSK